MTSIPYKVPNFINRHQAKDFLILLPGPSLKENISEIQKFNGEVRPITIACNNAHTLIPTDYVMFSNLKRFWNYAGDANPHKSFLLSCAFPWHLIKKRISGKAYERFYFRYENLKSFKLELINGVPHCDDHITVGSLAVYVAHQMGAARILIAGFDGYSASTQTHFYQESDNKDLQALQFSQEANHFHLKKLEELFPGKIRIITPTHFKDFYASGILNRT